MNPLSSSNVVLLSQSVSSEAEVSTFAEAYEQFYQAGWFKSEMSADWLEDRSSNGNLMAKAYLMVYLSYWSKDYNRPRSMAEDLRDVLCEWLNSSSVTVRMHAQFIAGECFLWGLGPPMYRDETRGIESLEGSAELGHPEAQYRIGELSFSGHGRPRDEILAMEYWRQAGKQGHAEAQGKLGEFYMLTNDSAQAIEWLGMAAAQGHPSSIVRLQEITHVP